jgi:hypothetical protein
VIPAVPTSTVNTAVVGSYTVTYNVSDAAGNPAIPVVRNVTVTPSVGTGGGGGGSMSIALLAGLYVLFLLSVVMHYRRPVRRRQRIKEEGISQ